MHACPSTRSSSQVHPTKAHLVLQSPQVLLGIGDVCFGSFHGELQGLQLPLQQALLLPHRCCSHLQRCLLALQRRNFLHTSAKQAHRTCFLSHTMADASCEITVAPIPKGTCLPSTVAIYYIVIACMLRGRASCCELHANLFIQALQCSNFSTHVSSTCCQDRQMQHMAGCA